MKLTPETRFQGVTIPYGYVRHLIPSDPIPDISSTTKALCGKQTTKGREWWLHNVTNPTRVCEKCEALRKQAEAT